FGVLLTIGLVVTHVLAVAVGRVIKMTILRLVDRFTGAILGLIMGMFVASLLITVTLELPFPRKFREQVAESSMSLFLRPVAGQVYNWVVSRASDRWDFDKIFKRGTTV
ncbi:MAG: CvpA family protein, partial [bacterium]|nr:CvpA family protein [bacterium]